MLLPSQELCYSISHGATCLVTGHQSHWLLQLCRCSMLFWYPCQIDREVHWQCQILTPSY